MRGVTLTVVLVDAIIRLSGISQRLSRLLLLQLGVDEHTMIVAWGGPLATMVW